MAVINMRFLSALACLLLYVFPAYAASSCYYLNGDVGTSQIKPCTNHLPSGSHSACCNLGKSPPDICLGGGLCQRMDSTEGDFVIYAVGCTDPTGKDSACPQYCPSEFQIYSLNPCWDGTISSWCCNDQQTTSLCCVNNRGSFAFNLTTLGVSNNPSQSTPVGSTITTNVCSNTGAVTGDMASCPSKNGTIIGSAIGAFFAGTLIAGLLGAYFTLRWANKHDQKAMSPNTSHITNTTEYRRELDTTSPSLKVPGSSSKRIIAQEISAQEIGAGKSKYEIDGRQVGNTTSDS
ncbi:hypothetical protein F5884DRAFT_756696 [Xylogone sp. PMI_703]|nr:hypothetical protein F5884DRAFT_756696 [Xylogone sp. PMI_703]